MARKALGKGLRALIPDAEAVGSPAGAPAGATGTAVESPPEAGVGGGPGAGESSGERLLRIAISAIVPNPHQPRTDWDPAALAQLTESIRQQGLLEPVVVRKRGEQYEIVAGERRLRACKEAGWEEIPAIVREFEDQESLEAALIENLQRADLNAVDEARAYEQLQLKFGLTHEEIARRVAKDRSTVSNLLRLLRLPDSILEHVSRGTVSVGHARLFLGLSPAKQRSLLARILKDGWSVRDAEAWVARQAAPGSARAARRRRAPTKSQEMQRIEDQLCRHFATETRIRFNRQGGRVEVRFSDEEELSRLLDVWGVIIN